MISQRQIRRLVSASCLSLLIAWQAIAASPIQQPNSIAREAAATAEVATAQDAAVTPAGCDTCCGDSSCANGGSCSGSCCCETVCCPKKVTEEVKKHYWEVNTEMVCIPGFRFECNWGKDKCCKSNGCCDSACGCTDACCSNDNCCSDACCSGGNCCGCKPNCEKCPCKDPGKPTCGRVRCIKVLEKHDYTCDECGYEWEVKCVRSGRGASRCGKGGCCCPSCGCAKVTSDDADVQLTSATQTTETTEDSSAEAPSLSRWLLGWLK